MDHHAYLYGDAGATRRLHQKDRVRDTAIEGQEAVRFSMSSMSSKFRKALNAWDGTAEYKPTQCYTKLYKYGTPLMGWRMYTDEA
jgi:CO dehydrogenase/acetyl-CoA synthase delta subunit